ncbi:MAG: ribosome small subunit-dependent GTPase A [Oscillospiraceae bacterium]|nr:ribosome small subunit-dependent GTPase A [Oscillospiraceae bacterium]
MKNNIVLKSIGGFYYIKTADGTVIECKAKGKFRKLALSPLAGDIVETEYEQGTNVITKIHTRKNQFVRPPFANLDLLVMVVATVEPNPNYFVIDKMCAIAQHKNADVVIAITKADLSQCEEIKDIYTKAGYKVFVTGEGQTEQLEALRNEMKGKICAFAGNSGVGKSTLLNRLFPHLELETNAISQKLGRGKHTTRQVEIFDMGDCMVADTPGFSSIELDRDNFISKYDLPHAFVEFGEYLDGCKFADCSHTSEIGCRIKQAVEDGEISQSRYDSYVAMYEKQKNVKDWELK